LWMAYGQFVRTFLLPLAAHTYLGWPLAACIQKRDGFEPADLYPYLSSTQRWRQPLRSLVTLPTLLEKRRKKGSAGPQLRQSPEIAEAVFRRNLRRLRKMLAALAPAERKTRWSDYPDAADHYTEADHKQKQLFVRRTLVTVQPAHVLDLGANTGVYSRIAASCGANVVGWDTDIAASEQSWQAAATQRLPIQPLVADPARPTPAVGWRNAETLSLLERARGRFDCVMMLGLIHHLLITDQIPLVQVVGLLRELTTRHAIVEWIPGSDPRFTEIVRGRDALYSNLNEAAFVSALDGYFSIVQGEQLSNGRTLFLLEVQ
jgi:SAM-dependent methyltransferase